MANIRQYIGARYTIKIYENSQDASSAEWEANTSYEPLVMVTYNNSSYLSKKDVPANIGNPAQNPLYWIVTGAYNGQIAQLQNDVSALQIAVNTMDTDVDTLESKLLSLSLYNKQIAVYGDSWGDPDNYFDAWIDKLSLYTGKTVHNVSNDGYTFAQINNAFDNYNADVYIVEGGINDWNNNEDPEVVIAALVGIIVKIKAVNPAADIIFTTPISHVNHTNYAGITSYYPMDLYRQCIWHVAIQYHCFVCSGLKMAHVDMGDGLHPAATNAEFIADAIIKSYLAGGDSRDFDDDWCWGDGDHKCFIEMRGGSPFLTFKGNITFSNGSATLANALYNTARLFIVPSINRTIKVGTAFFDCNMTFDANGFNFTAYAIGDGNAANGAISLDFESIPLTFKGMSYRTF